MAELREIRNQIVTLTFDCYGTLIDWDTGLNASFAEIFGPPAARRRRELFDAYVEIEAEIEGGPYRPYREVLSEVTGRLAARMGWPLAEDKKSRLAALLPTWPPFADTGAALIELGKKFRLGVLSNVDRDLFSGTSRHFPISFDFVVTAQDVGSYKPAHGHFLEMLSRHADRESTLHVAQSQFHDGRPCNALGIAFAWINRYKDPADPSVRACEVFSDLKSLAAALLE